jgi:hypothetical protein
MTAARAERSAPPGGSMADAVLNALPHPVITIGADGYVVDANARIRSSERCGFGCPAVM